MIKQLFILLTFISFTNFSYIYSHTGTAKSYSMQTDWKKQTHVVHMEYTLDDENTPRSMQLHLSLEEMVEFPTQEGGSFTILEELPDALVGQSLFQLQLAENAYTYNAKGPSISLKDPKEWGVDDNSFMVTAVSLPKVTLNGKDSMHVHSVDGELLGKIFSMHPVEHFIPNKPGLSNFYYYSEDQESWFMYEASSKDSHWTPSPEQLASAQIVTSTHRYVIQLDGAPISHHSFHLYSPKVGSRWVYITESEWIAPTGYRSHRKFWVDLDDAKFIEARWPYTRIEVITVVVKDLVKTWD